MKRIFGAGALDLLPLPGGFAFAAAETVEEKQVVAFNVYSIDKSKLSSVTRAVYQMAKFGQDRKNVIQGVKDYLNCMAVNLPDGHILLAYPDGKAKIVNDDGHAVWKGEFIYKDHGPAALVVVGNSLWGSFPESNCLLRYNLRGMREDLRLGGNQPNFGEPFGLFKMDEDDLLVCNRRMCAIKQVNTQSYTVNDYAEFEEPVLDYAKIGAHEYVRLKSGIYRL